MFNLFKKKHRDSLQDDNPNFEERYIRKMEINPKGGELTYIMGEKYPLRGNPKKLALMALEPIKSLIDKLITSRLVNLIPFTTSNDKLSEPIQELARVFDLLIDAQKLEGNKKKWKAYKKVLCAFFENDLPYRYIMQWIFERLDKEKMKLKDGDKYFFRAKNFWVDIEEDYAKAEKVLGKERFAEFKEFLSKDTWWNKAGINSASATMEDAVKLFLTK